jgi:pre-rRNA-processing protein TSR1
MTKPGSSYHDPNHHRSSIKPNKPFKGRHSHKSKSALKTASKGSSQSHLRSILTILGKVEKENAYQPKNHVPSKIERRNTQKQLQKNKKEEQVRNARFFGGSRGAAKIIVSAMIDTGLHCQGCGIIMP